MDMRQLRALRAVADEGTVAAAAGVLGYTPSAVSQQVSALGRSIGVPVLERVGRNVRLTDAGRELADRAVRILSEVEAASAAVERVAVEVAGPLDVAVFESILLPILVPALDALGRAHPELEVRAHEIDPDQALAMVERGALDVTFYADYPHSPGPRPEGVSRVPVHRDTFFVALPEGLDAPDPVPLEWLADRPLIMPPAAASCGRCLVQALRAVGVEPRTRHEVGAYPAAYGLVAAGQGLALVASVAAGSCPPGVARRALAQPVFREVELVCRSSSAERPAVRALIEAVLEVAARLELVVPPTGRGRAELRTPAPA